MKIKFCIYLIVIVVFSSCNYAAALIMAIPEKSKVENHKIEKYNLKLIRKQGWAGPACYGYEVRKKHFGIYGFKKYYWCSRDSVKNCIVRLKDDKLIFDKCTNKLIKD